MKIEQVEAINSNNTFYGASIVLYRWMLNESNHHSQKNFNFMVWGYFDQMNIKCDIHCMRDFYIDNDENENIRFESQRMCIYTDDKKGLDILLPELKWNEKYFPIIVITEIKLNVPDDSNSVLGMTNSEYFTDCEIEIKSFIQEQVIDKSNILFHQFYSLGYSDLVIVFRGQSYSEIMNIIKNLRNLSVVKQNVRNRKRKSNLTKIISSTYSITGVDVSQTSKVLKSDVNLSVRISLKSSCDLEKAIKKISTCLEIDRDCVRPVFGKYDLDVVLESYDPQKYIKVCGIDNKSILNPISDEYHEFINYRNTRWIGSLTDDLSRTNGKNTKQIVEEHESTKKLENNVPTDKIHELYNICKFLNDNKLLPEPLYFSFTLLTKCYIQIIQNDVSEIILSKKMEKIFVNFVYMILWNLNLNERQQKAILKKGKLFRIPKKKEIDLDIGSFETGIMIINDLIQNRIHASRMIFEMPNYSQNIIDTSTDVAKAYSNIVNFMQSESKYLPDFRPGVESNYFIIFNNTLEIETHSLFPTLVKKSKKRLIGIHLNNMSFYDFKFSIPYIFHEIGHYIEPISQIKINDSFHECLCSFISQILFGELFSSLTYGESSKRFDEPELRSTIDEILIDFAKIIKYETKIELDQYSKIYRNNISKNVWNFFYDIEKKQSKEENYKKILIKSDLRKACYKFRCYIKSSKDVDRTKDIINSLARSNILENRDSNFHHLQNMIIQYFSDDHNRDDFFGLANYYFNLFGEIIADFVMISILNLDKNMYQNVINNYFKIHGSKHSFEDYQIESDIRRIVLACSGVIESDKEPDSTLSESTSKLFSPLIDLLKEYNESEKWKVFINRSSIINMQNLYSKYIQDQSSGEQFSDEMKFMLSTLKDFA